MFEKVIITDDSMILRRAIKLILEKQKYQVFEAFDGSDLMQKYTEVNPDIVLLDLNMPGISGKQTLKILKKNHPSCKIIIYSSDTSKDSIYESLKNGADYYLIKPAPPEEIYRVINKILEDNLNNKDS